MLVWCFEASSNNNYQNKQTSFINIDKNNNSFAFSRPSSIFPRKRENIKVFTDSFSETYSGSFIIDTYYGVSKMYRTKPKSFQSLESCLFLLESFGRSSTFSVTSSLIFLDCSCIAVSLGLIDILTNAFMSQL